MKKILPILLLILAFGTINAVFAQNKATTPTKNSPVRRAIIAAVKKKFGKVQKNIENPSVLKVQGNWARIVYDVKSDGDEGSTGVNLILKKSGSAWKIVWDFNKSGEEDVSDHIKNIPEGILNPWEN